jgi:hypothetical protein
MNWGTHSPTPCFNLLALSSSTSASQLHMVGVLLWASNSFPSIFLGWKYEKENFKKICRARSFFSGVLPIGMYTLLTMYLTANFLIYESWIQESYFFFCVKLITHVWFMMWRELFNWIFQLQFSNYRELAPSRPHHLAKKETNTKCCHLAIKKERLTWKWRNSK